MYEIRLHGRGGQGVVTAAELLSVAAFREGRYAQAFPSFGSERTGAPVAAFCRVDDEPIRLREPVQAPDALIVQDTTLLTQVDVFAGLTRGGLVLLNTRQERSRLGLDRLGLDRCGVDREGGAPRAGQLVLVPATGLALEHLGRPLPNAALLGGFAAASGLICLDAVAAAIRERFTGRVAEANVAAAAAAYDIVRIQLKERSRA